MTALLARGVKGLVFAAGFAKGLAFHAPRSRRVCLSLAGVMGMASASSAAAAAATVGASMAFAGGSDAADRAEAIGNIALYRGGIPPFTREGAAESSVMSRDLWRERGQVIAVLRRPK
jgi:hypothetical protein